MRVIVIGGGPAGMMAAIAAAENKAEVILIERNEKVGKKLYLTGKGRCNLTNACDISEFFDNIPRNADFLYSALYSFSNADFMNFLKERRLPFKIERGQRVFPESDKASDVTNALSATMKRLGVKVHYNERVNDIIIQNGHVCEAVSDKNRYSAEAIILCCGGKSYPSTGSDGSSYKLAERLGHEIIPCTPALVPIVTKESYPALLQGLSLRNVTLKVKEGKHCIFEELGEMLFTSNGISGPLVLTASSSIEPDKLNKVHIQIDLKPGLSAEKLNDRVLEDLSLNQRKSLRNSLNALLPQRLIPVIIEISGIDGDKPANQITKEERRMLVGVIKALPLTPKEFAPIDEAIITRGGVSVKQINSSTMESKLVRGLYFAGEMMDVDAYTGGFNIQIAVSTGRLAGISATQKKFT